MPLAVTHVLLTIIAVDLYRDYITKHKKYFTIFTLFIAGIGGILPDIDIPINSMLLLLGAESPELFHHGGLTHTPFFGIIFLVPGLVLWAVKKHKVAVIFFVLTFGIFMHSILDYTIGGGDPNGLMLLYPLSEERIKLGVLLGGEALFSTAALDAVILLLWLFHEERKHKIRDFI